MQFINKKFATGFKNARAFGENMGQVLNMFQNQVADHEIIGCAHTVPRLGQVEKNESTTVEVDAFVHHISDFTNAASVNGLKLVRFNEYWHEADEGKPPRVVSFLFAKG